MDQANLNALIEILRAYEDLDTNAEAFFEVFAQRAENIRRLVFDLGGES